MKAHLSLFKISTLTCLSLITLILTIGQATAENRKFHLYLKNGFNHAVTFNIEMVHCYQGTGRYDPRKLTQGPIAAGGYVKLDVARDQHKDCNGNQGAFNISTTDPRHKGSKQGFSFDNAGHLSIRQIPDNFSGHLSTKSTQNGSYTWTASAQIPSITPEHNRLIRIQNVTSGEYLTQSYNGNNDDSRNVTVWSLPEVKNNGFRWVMQNAGGGYWHFINLASGLALTWDGSGQNVSNWGITDKNNPNQLWRLEHYNNRYMIINKATGQGLNQAYGGVNPDKKNVTIWPKQTFNGNGWSWLLQDGGQADLVQLTIQSVKAIKTSTGQDVGTEILFGAIEAAATGGSSTASKVGQTAVKLTTKQVIKRQAKQAVKEGAKSALDASARELSGVNTYQDAYDDEVNTRQDALKDQVRNQNNVVGTAGEIGLDALNAVDDFGKATSLQNAFNTIYGESPDDLNIKVNNVSIWPNGGRDSRKIKSQQTLPVNTKYIFDKSKGLAIQLVEYDYGSGDDSLGWIGFTQQELSQPKRYEEVLVRSDSEGSLYQLTFSLSPFALNVANQTEQSKSQADLKLHYDQQIQVQKKLREEENKIRLAREQEDSRQKREKEKAAATPASAELTIWTEQLGGNRRNRLPLTWDDPIIKSEKIVWKPDISLQVTMANGKRLREYEYELLFPGKAIFDDVSGDPNDLIKVITNSAKNASILKATSKGTGKATLHVSFVDAPGVTASLPVEVVTGHPPPLNLNGNWSSQYTCPNGQVLPLYLNVLHQRNEITALSAINDGCLSDGVKVWSGTLDSNYKGNLTCGAIYDAGSGNYAIQYVASTIDVINENELVACTLPFKRMRPDDTMQTGLYVPPTPKPVPSSPKLIASFGAAVDVTQFSLLNDSNFAWAISWIDGQGTISNSGATVQPGQPWEVKNGGKTWESHWFAISYQGQFLCSISLRQGASVRYSELSACQQSIPVSTAQIQQAPPAKSAAQFYNDWVNVVKSEISLPTTVDVFEITKVYSVCSSGCEQEYHDATLALELTTPNHSQQQLPNSDGVQGKLEELFLSDYCTSDEQELGGTISFLVTDRYGARLATPVFTSTDCP